MNETEMDIAKIAAEQTNKKNNYDALKKLIEENYSNPLQDRVRNTISQIPIRSGLLPTSNQNQVHANESDSMQDDLKLLQEMSQSAKNSPTVPQNPQAVTGLLSGGNLIANKTFEDAQRALDINDFQAKNDLLYGEKFARSSEDYFDDEYMRLRRAGYGHGDAKELAAEHKRKYQLERQMAYRQGLDLYGKAGNAINDFGLNILNRLGEENPQESETILNAYALPENEYNNAFTVGLSKLAHALGMNKLLQQQLGNMDLQNLRDSNALDRQHDQQGFDWKKFITGEQGKNDRTVYVQNQENAINNERNQTSRIVAKIKAENSGGEKSKKKILTYEERLKYKEKYGKLKTDLNKWLEGNPDKSRTDWEYWEAYQEADYIVNNRWTADENTANGMWSLATDVLETAIRDYGGKLTFGEFKEFMDKIYPNNQFKDEVVQRIKLQKSPYIDWENSQNS